MHFLSTTYKWPYMIYGLHKLYNNLFSRWKDGGGGTKGVDMSRWSMLREMPGFALTLLNAACNLYLVIL